MDWKLVAVVAALEAVGLCALTFLASRGIVPGEVVVAAAGAAGGHLLGWTQAPPRKDGAS